MDLFEAKSDRGLERRVDEGDLRNLYRAGYLHLDSVVRRSGSPNWFRVDEMFPEFEKISSEKIYGANLRSGGKRVRLRTWLVLVFLVVFLAFSLLRFSRKITRPRLRPITPASQNQPGS